VVRRDCEHVHYVHPLKFDGGQAGLSRDRFISAVKAELAPTELRENEGVKLSCGYVKPLYLQPIFKKRICYGSKGFPFKSRCYKSQVKYEEGICPVAERLYNKELFTHELMHPFMTKEDLDDVVKAFMKAWENRKEI
jgi:dTDP-4-amino-4,6-dideoxygalactose transaminase